MMDSSRDGAPTLLRRRITGGQALLLVVGSMVGTGILVTPATVAAAAGTPLAVLLVWGGGALYALMGALSQAELAALHPEAGGDYVFLRENLGKGIAFLSGWVSLTVGFAGSIAAVSMSCGQYLGHAGVELGVAGLPQQETLAVLVIATLTGINLLGVSEGSLTQALLTLGKVGLLVALTVAALSVEAAAEPSPAAEVPTLPLWAAFLPVVFSYTGWNDAIYVGSEVKDPGRSLPLALIGGTALTAVLYLAFNYAYVATTGGAGGNRELAAAAGMAELLFPQEASRLLAMLASLLLLGTVAAMVITGPRIGYAMAVDGFLPARLARVSPRGVPADALLLQGALALFFVALGSVEEIISWVGFVIVVFSALATLCVFVERRRGRRTAYRIPLYPLPPLLYVAASLLIAAWVAWANPLGMAKGLAIVLTGLPVYWWCARTRRG